MTQLSAEQIQGTIDSCRAHLAELSDALRATFGCAVRLAPLEPTPQSAEGSAAAEPGLALSLALGNQGDGALLLIPASLPLPDWCREPGELETERFRTFARDVSQRIIPPDFQSENFAATWAENLQEFVQRAPVSPSAARLELAVLLADAAEKDVPRARILLVVPILAKRISPLDIPRASLDEIDDSLEPAADSAPEQFAGQEPPEQTDVPDGISRGESVPSADSDIDEEVPEGERSEALLSADLALRALRVMHVPVTVSVRLAERRVPLGQVVALAPGALITFNKSCEELLDLFVNNHRYCQGEAVKVGENFGLKVDRVDVAEDRPEHIF